MFPRVSFLTKRFQKKEKRKAHLPTAKVCLFPEMYKFHSLTIWSLLFPRATLIQTIHKWKFVFLSISEINDVLQAGLGILFSNSGKNISVVLISLVLVQTTFPSSSKDTEKSKSGRQKVGQKN